MAIALVQTAAIGSTSSGTSQSTSAFGSNPTVGNYIIAWAFGQQGSSHTQTPTISDTGGNTYTVPTNVYQNENEDYWCIIAYTKVATSGSTFKITSNSPATTASVVMVVAGEFSGIASSSPLDGAAGTGTTSGSSGTPNPGSLVVSTGSIEVACFVTDSGNTPTVPSGWTAIGTQTNGSTFEVGQAIYRINGASPQNPTWNSMTAGWSASQFALLAASGGGGGGSSRSLFRQSLLNGLGAGGSFFGNPIGRHRVPPLIAHRGLWLPPHILRRSA